MLRTMLGIGIGAMATFFADPQNGRRRRLQARDQFIRASRKTRGAIDTTARELANRTPEVMAIVRGTLGHEVIDNRRLVKRIRAAVGLGRPRRYAWARKTEVLAAAAGLAATGLYIANSTRR
jgi:hypothetical protein